MWCGAVKFGGDSGAVQQVSDIGGGFGRVPFTAQSRGCHEIDVKREIISAPLRPSEDGRAQAVARATRAGDAGLRRMRRLTRIFVGIFARERHRSFIARRARPNARRFDSRRLPAASLQDHVDLQDLVEGNGGVLDAVAGRLAVAAHGIEAIVDRADRKPMARMRHGR
jgi:hypothetical protein